MSRVRDVTPRTLIHMVGRVQVISAALGAVGVHAAAGAGTGNPEIDTILSLLQVPVFGLLVVALIRGWLVTGKEYQRVLEERNQEREERIKAQTALTGDVLPTLHGAQLALERATAVIEKLPATVRRRT